MQTIATYKSGKKAGQPRPVKQDKPGKYAPANAYILASIMAEGYLDNPVTDSEKLAFLRATFKSEYGWAIQRNGEFAALVEWLQGLPSSINIAFYNHDILRLAREWGSLPDSASEKQEDKILESYWRYMAMRILGLWRAYKIN